MSPRAYGAARWRGLAALGLLAGFVVAVHAPLGRADFSLDDLDYVLNNVAIRSLPAALAGFGEPFPPQLPGKALYRPVTGLTYAADFALWGEQARGFHASNVALYVLVVWGVFALARRLLGPGAGGPAFAVALLFAAHPVHCEAVDSITGRSEVLALGFSLLSLLAFARAVPPGGAGEGVAGAGPPRRAVWLAASAGAYALAALSKETGAVLPALLGLHFAVYGRAAGEPARAWLARGARCLAPHAAVAGLYLAARWSALDGFTPVAASGVGPSQRVLHAGIAFFEYARLLVAPVEHHVDFYWEQRFLPGRAALLRSLAGWLLLGVVLRVSLAALRLELARGLTRAGRAALLGAGLFGVFWLPVSHAVPIEARMGERLLFAPSLGFLLAAVIGARALLERWGAPPGRRRAVAAAALVALALLGGWRSHARAAQWRDDLRLWSYEAEALPDDARALANLALAYGKRERWRDALVALGRARRAPPVKGLEPVLDGIEDWLRSERRAKNRSRAR